MPEVKSTIEHVPGFKVAGVHAGLRSNGAVDMALIFSETPCAAAGVFTTNQIKAAPVLYDMDVLKYNNSHIRAVVINTRCANACTGQQGLDNTREMARYAAEQLGVGEDEVLVLSTGVIGTQLPMDKIKHGVDVSVDALGNDWEATARGIMTTDTRPKMASVEVTASSGQTYHIAGIAKGAGMIAPNMATMLGIVVTDASLAPDSAQRCLKNSMEHSFNHIVVDGDTSTNDTVFLLAGGSVKTSDEQQFQNALNAVCRKLAQDVVRDGEGVTKFITLTVQGISDSESAHRVANTIATSPLVKTAFFGGDANWGRIVAAAGRAGVVIEPEKVKLWITPGEETRQCPESLLLFDAGMPTHYSEERATEIFKQPSVSILLDCGVGSGSATIWTCDLSHDYVSINGDYRS